jgi:hypothetical protein
VACFGNAHVQWDNTNPVVMTSEVPLRDFKPASGTRRSGLTALAKPQLLETLAGLGASCESCASEGHLVSKIRAVCLELTPKNVKAALTRRGIKCEGCTNREQYLDKLLDAVHLPERRAR